LFFREKKHNSNRLKGVGVLSILSRVKKIAKRVIFGPNFINGLNSYFLYDFLFAENSFRELR
jgi:hypothetical protein